MSEWSALILALGWVAGCWVLRMTKVVRPASEARPTEPVDVTTGVRPGSDDDDLTEFQHWLEEGGHAFSEDVRMQVEWAFGRLLGRDADQGSEELAREILTRWASPTGAG